ncbi:hypothetical protein B0H19DRAFT_1080731 [Mycena capillaripes]|nr:hypothetical protein B0H19DRAFT_1080731 [Mycena capillaripes]
MSEIPPAGLDGSTAPVQRLPLAARRGGATAKASRSNTPQAPLPSAIPTRGGLPSSGSSRQPTTALSRRGRGARMGSTYHLDDTDSGSSTRPRNVNQTEAESSGPLVAESSIPASPMLEPPNSDLPAAPVVQDRRQITAREHLHPHWYIRCIMYLVAFLHTRHRVTFRAAGVILICVGLIFSFLFGGLIGALAMPRTLKTVFARFEMKDRFTVNPICFQCHVIFEPHIQPPTFCPECDEDVFGAPERDDENRWESTDSEPGETPSSPASRKPKPKPNMVSPMQFLSSGLQDFFSRPGMVDAVEAWRKRSSADGELKSMQDAEVWSEQKQFRTKYRTENHILSGMTGQKEPTAKQLQPHLKIIVDDLIMLYEDGIVIKTPEYPDGRITNYLPAKHVKNIENQFTMCSIFSRLQHAKYVQSIFSMANIMQKISKSWRKYFEYLLYIKPANIQKAL